jgi:hypothetical protein
MINIWMDGVSLGFVIWLLFYLNMRLAWISIGLPDSGAQRTRRGSPPG